MTTAATACAAANCWCRRPRRRAAAARWRAAWRWTWSGRCRVWSSAWCWSACLGRSRYERKRKGVADFPEEQAKVTSRQAVAPHASLQLVLMRMSAGRRGGWPARGCAAAGARGRGAAEGRRPRAHRRQRRAGRQAEGESWRSHSTLYTRRMPAALASALPTKPLSSPAGALLRAARPPGRPARAVRAVAAAAGGAVRGYVVAVGRAAQPHDGRTGGAPQPPAPWP